MTQSYPWLKLYPKNVDYFARWDNAPLYKLIDDAAAEFGGRPAFDFLGKKYTYKNLHDAIDRVAAGLQALGVGKGTHVGLILPNCPFYPIAFFAVLKAGGTVVNFNPLYTEREIAAQMNDSGATMMVTLDLKMVTDKLDALWSKTKLQKIVVARMADALPFPKSVLYRLFKHKDTARLPEDDRHIKFAALLKSEAFLSPVTIDPGATSPCCNIPAARPASRRARC